MTSKTISMKRGFGMGSKEAAQLINRASVFQSNITLKKGDHQANAKSLLGVVSLCAFEGNEMTVVAAGADEEAAVNDLIQFLQGN